jgi:uncharacterized membrane protein YhiD involved in acid resistance
MRIRTIIATGAVTTVGVSIATGTAWLAAAVVVLYVVQLFIRDAVQRRSREDAWNAVRYNVMPGEDQGGEV